MEHTIEINADHAEISKLPEVYLHFTHFPFAIVWNAKTRTQDVVRGVGTFYGGMGEGSRFDTWRDAIHSSLYDAFQVYEELKDGDTFVAEYLGETARFACEGVHVVRA